MALSSQVLHLASFNAANWKNTLKNTCFDTKTEQLWFLVEVGYAGGEIENPSYQDVCTGATNHNEVVRAGSSQWKNAQLKSEILET